MDENSVDFGVATITAEEEEEEEEFATADTETEIFKLPSGEEDSAYLNGGLLSLLGPSEKRYRGADVKPTVLQQAVLTVAKVFFIVLKLAKFPSKSIERQYTSYALLANRPDVIFTSNKVEVMLVSVARKVLNGEFNTKLEEKSMVPEGNAWQENLQPGG